MISEFHGIATKLLEVWIAELEPKAQELFVCPRESGSGWWQFVPAGLTF